MVGDEEAPTQDGERCMVTPRTIRGKKLIGRGWKRERMGKEARRRRGSGLPAGLLIKRFSGALMGPVMENYQGERPENALLMIEWVWLGSPSHQPLRPVPHQWTLRPWLSELHQRGLQECVVAHGGSEREGPF